MKNSPLPPAAPAEPFALRAFRAVVLLALCATISFLFVLAAVALLNPFTENDEHFRVAMLTSLGVAVFLPVLLIWAAYRLRLRSWWWLGGGWLALLPVLAYLAADDAVIRRPVTMEEVAPSFPGAEDSYRVLMRYAKGAPAAEAFKVAGVGRPKEVELLAAHAEANRAKIEAVWAELATERAWYDELSAFDRIGDLGEASYKAPIPAFAAHRIVAQTALLKAVLLALDGRGDEAIAILLPVLDVGWKMQVTSRSLVRSMIGNTVRHQALEGVAFTLDHTPVSPDMRARLQAVLGAGSAGEAGVRRLVGIEYVFWAAGTMTDYYLGADSSVPAIIRGPIRVIAPLVINPHRTINEAGDIMAELQDLAARRQPMNPTRLAALTGGTLNIKNLGGQLVIYAGLPGYQGVTDRYWRTEDLLADVRGRVTQP